MHIVFIIVGVVLILAVLLDGFETVVLPRRVQRSFRITSWFYRNTWRPWSRASLHIRKNSRREAFLGYFGPLSLIFLLGLWALTLIFGFTLLQYGAGEHITSNNVPITFGLLLYHSGETFFTLGYGDVVPSSQLSRFLSVSEAGLGFAFLGTVIGYLPTIYSSFSKREIEISMLDARAGSPPSAAELLVRFGKTRDQSVLDQILRGWERWSAELLESHLSYPPLSFFRSQHSNQSWLGALTTMLDTTALIIAGIEDVRADQAKLTFAMARHAVVDLTQVVHAEYCVENLDRLAPPEMDQLRATLMTAGIKLRQGEQFDNKLAYLRTLYEPYAHALARNLLITLPPWVSTEKRKDNWQSGPWDRLIQAKGLAILGQHAPAKIFVPDDHF